MISLTTPALSHSRTTLSRPAALQTIELSTQQTTNTAIFTLLSLPRQIIYLLKHLVRRLYNLGVRFIRTLRQNHLDEFFNNIHV